MRRSKKATRPSTSHRHVGHAPIKRRPFPYWTEKLDGGFTKGIFANRATGQEVHVLRHPGGAVIGVWTTYSRHARSGQQERRVARKRARLARRANRRG